MNRYFIILAALVVIVAAGAVIFSLRSSPSAPLGQDGTLIVTPPATVGPSTDAMPSSAVASKGDVRSAFQNKIASYNPDNIVPQETVVAGNWALQLWVGDAMGGEALLKFDTAQARWGVVDIGGGSWSVDGLVSFGVPRDIAGALIAGRPY